MQFADCSRECETFVQYLLLGEVWEKCSKGGKEKGKREQGGCEVVLQGCDGA